MNRLSPLFATPALAIAVIAIEQQLESRRG
jgi:hypothetical protein